MTNDIREALGTCVNDPPDNLVALYSNPFPTNPQLGIKILDLRDAIKYNRAIQNRAFLVNPMGLFALDDANDSNPFCYITRGPARGCILHLYHDGDTAVEYPSLSAFLAELKSALENQRHIIDLGNKVFRPKLDQRQLADHIGRLCQADTDEAECELIVLARLLDTAQIETVRFLAEHSSFFVREATAQLIASNPSAQLVDIAKSLANDRHPQGERIKVCLTTCLGWKDSENG